MSAPERPASAELASADAASAAARERDAFDGAHRREAGALLLAVFVAAISGIVNELLLGTAASFLLGDSIREWSLTIGTFLAAMGAGSFASRWVRGALLRALLGTELVAALLGGFGPLVFFGAYALNEDLATPTFYLVVAGVGFVVGLEVPLLTRALHDYGGLRETLASVFGLDYGGALVASLAYPFVLYPALGVVRTAMVAGLFNLSGALLILYAFSRREGRLHRAGLASVLVTLALVLGGLAVSASLTQEIDRRLFAPEELVYVERTHYQHLALTRGRGGETRLYLNGHLQFASHDEARYHEALVHVPWAIRTLQASQDEGVDSTGLRVLVLGGGDGLATRELLTHDPAALTLVDLDPAVTELAQTHPLLRQLNQDAFADPRVEIVHDDALQWLRRASPASVDLIVVDLPDPSTPALARLYSVQFDRLLRRALAPGGVGVVQAGSPWFARDAYWSIEASLRAAGLETLPYHLHIPSFGEWGFVAFSRAPLAPPRRLVSSRSYRFLDDAVLPGLFVFPADLARVEVPAHTVMAPQLPERFLRGWRERGG